MVNQQQINEAEWADERNWSGPRLLGFYRSKRDTRAVVPKRTRSLGWTINVGRPKGVLVLVGILVGVPLLELLVSVAMKS